MSTQLAPIVGPEATSILTVLKAKLKNQLLYAEFTEQHDEEASPRAFTMQGTELVHPDLTRALAQLVPHLCLLTEQLHETADYWPEEAAEWPPRFAPYTVTGFSMGRGGAGITLTGQRELAGGKILNLNSPYTAFEEENSTYQYTGLLETAVLDAIAEVELALRGKCNEAGRQLDMFDAEQNKEEVIAEFGEVTKNFPAPKKRKAKRIGE